VTGKTVIHYKILEELNGGMAVVYKAWDLRLERFVAIKFLPEGLAKDPQALELFHREARAIAALDHPNVCTIYDSGEHEGRPFIVMQLLEGQTNERTHSLCKLSEADLLALIPDLAELLRNTGTEYWWMKKRVFNAFESHGFHVTRDHFYSPQPTVANLTPALWEGPRYVNPAFTFDMEGMRALVADLTPYANELADIPRISPSGFYWDNHFFPNFDAIVYYGLCRRFRPATVLEIGSGFSTHIALRAAQQNGMTQVCCIEPYPTATLRVIEDGLSKLLVQPVQDVPLEVFQDLQAGDILFVDTSHVSKLGSDLHHILFHILPALPDGILIHFHDIFLPHEYPREWVVERNWFWNEQYLLRAFLMYNEAFRVVLMNHHFLYTYPQVAEEALGGRCGPLNGVSLWLRKESSA